MKKPGLFNWLIVFFVVSTISLNYTQAAALNLNGAMRGLGQGISDYGKQQMEIERQKELMRYQYELEEERKRLAEETLRKEIERQNEAKEAADREEKQNATYTGTGFFVNPSGYLITNSHVIEGKAHIAVKDFKGNFYRVSIVSLDNNNDFALLHVSGNFHSLRIADSGQVQKGQHVFTVGYPQISIQGNESKVTDGIINSFTGLNNDNNWFQISVPIQGGNSGGPLVNEKGEVIGVVVASLNIQKFYSQTGSIPQNVNYAIKSSLLKQFITAQQVRNDYLPADESSIMAVDRATVLVIAQNTPIDVRFEVAPIDKKAEDAKLAQTHPNWQTIIQSTEFKKWLKTKPDLHDSLNSEQAISRATVLDAYNNYLKGIAESFRRSEAERVEKEREQKTVELVTKVFPDWPELKNDPEFMKWLSAQPQTTKTKVESLNVEDILSVVRIYKEQPVKILTEIGRVKTIFQHYNYLVFALNDDGYQKIENVVIVSNGEKIVGSIEKRIGGEVSVTINLNDISKISNGDTVFESK